MGRAQSLETVRVVCSLLLVSASLGHAASWAGWRARRDALSGRSVLLLYSVLPPIDDEQYVLMQYEEGGKRQPATVLSKCDKPRSYNLRAPNGATDVHQEQETHLPGPSTQHPGNNLTMPTTTTMANFYFSQMDSKRETSTVAVNLIIP